MSEFTLAFHLVVFKLSSVLMALGPSVSAEALLTVILEVPLVTRTISVGSETIFAVSLVVRPLALILSHYTVGVPLAVIKL